jgi:hypothetical protein
LTSNEAIHPYRPDLARRRLAQATVAAGGLAIGGAAAPFLASLAPASGRVRRARLSRRICPASARPSSPPSSGAATRSRRPEVFVAVGLCTHLGCVPSYRPEPQSLQPGWPGGFYCPCHGSKFDLAGRVYRGSPAPTNLVVPPHSFPAGNLILIGEDETTSGSSG